MFYLILPINSKKHYIFITLIHVKCNITFVRVLLQYIKSYVGDMCEMGLHLTGSGLGIRIRVKLGLLGFKHVRLNKILSGYWNLHYSLLIWESYLKIFAIEPIRAFKKARGLWNISGPGFVELLAFVVRAWHWARAHFWSNIEYPALSCSSEA